MKDGGDQNGVPDPKRLKAGHSLNDSKTPKPLFCGCPSPRPLVSPLENRGGVPNPRGYPRSNPCGAYQVLSASDGGPRTIKVGHWLAPDQHVAKAKEVSHPFDLVSAVEELSAEAVDVCMSMSDDQLVQQRKLAVLKLRIKAKTLERQEQELHKTFPPWFEKVVAKKKLLLWESLLRDYAFDDLGVIKFMMEGVPIVGQLERSSASLSEASLLPSSAPAESPQAAAASSTRSILCRAALHPSLPVLPLPPSGLRLGHIIAPLWCLHLLLCFPRGCPQAF